MSGTARAAVAASTCAAALAAALALPACAGGGGGPAPLAQRGHAQCPLAGRDERSLLIDGVADWRVAGLPDETAALGRAVDWPRERVLVHALAQQPTLGVRVDAVALPAAAAGRAEPALGLRITRPAPDAMAATALSRPCVVVALPRDGWQALQLVDADAPARTIARVVVAPLEAGPRKFPHGAGAAPGREVMPPR